MKPAIRQDDLSEQNVTHQQDLLGEYSDELKDYKDELQRAIATNSSDTNYLKGEVELYKKREAEQQVYVEQSKIVYANYKQIEDDEILGWSLGSAGIAIAGALVPTVFVYSCATCFAGCAVGATYCIACAKKCSKN